jgi:3-oxoacyl-[acyl-carrier protein] reductase
MMIFHPECLKNKVALVTGASRGIGKSIAIALKNAGATVIGTATSENGATQIMTYCDDGIVMNVSTPDAVQALLTVQAKHGKIDILVNNAGITQDNLALRMKEQEWHDVVETNLTGVYRLSQAVLKSMMKQRFGRIINITSVVGSSGNPGQMNYAATKAGVAGMSRALAHEMGSRGITVNCVAPGFITTDMTDVLSDEQKTALAQKIPLGRLGTADEVANTVVFLASDAGGYITGSEIHVNGGMYML